MFAALSDYGFLPFERTHQIRRVATAEQRDMTDRHGPPTAPGRCVKSLLSTFPDRMCRTARYPCQRRNTRLHKKETFDIQLTFFVHLIMLITNRYRVVPGSASSTSARCARGTVLVLSKLHKDVLIKSHKRVEAKKLGKAMSLFRWKR